MTPRHPILPLVSLAFAAGVCLAAGAAAADPPDAKTKAAIEHHFMESGEHLPSDASTPVKGDPTASPEAMVSFFTSETPADVTVAARRPHVDLDITFDFDSADLNKDGISQLDTAGQALNDPRLASHKFMLSGHTDDLGNPEYNRKLSEERAESAKRYLVQKYGIDPSRLETAGFGSEHPKDPHHTPEARQKNRRVVLEMVD